MTDYTIFNVVLFLIVMPVAWFLVPSRSDYAQALRVAVIVALLAYPWDFLAISLRAWEYGDPGPLLYSVPANDLAFIFLCSLLTSSILIRLFFSNVPGPTTSSRSSGQRLGLDRTGIPQARQDQPEAEHRGTESARCDGG